MLQEFKEFEEFEEFKEFKEFKEHGQIPWSAPDFVPSSFVILPSLRFGAAWIWRALPRA